MRTILIPLILICSLTQFENVQAAEKKPLDPTYYQCGTVFNCFVPEVCVNDGLGSAISAGKVSQVLAATDVTLDCPAIVRYHLYAPHWAHVSISSLKDDITSIEFVRTDSNNNEKLKFSCIRDTNEIIGKYQDQVKSTNDEFDPTAKLECTFQVVIERGRNNAIMELISNNLVLIRTFVGTVQDSTIPFKVQISSDTSCDPTYLQFYTEDTKEDSDKVMYRKINFRPGKYDCDTNYEIQYQKKGQKKYKQIDEIECNDLGKFVIKDKHGSTTIDAFDTINVRCASEAKYYCTYEPKPKEGETALQYKASSWNPKKETILKCPSTQSIINIVKDNLEISLLDSYSIECENYGNKQYWVVKEGSSTKKYKLKQDGPPVYCSATVKCKRQHFKMSNSQVKNGFLDTNHLPKCGREDGKLLVGDKEVLNTGCNEQTGKYFYTLVDGNKEDIDDQTQFVCKFPPVENTKKNAENQKFVWTGVGVAGGIAVALVVVFIFGLYFGCRHLENRKRRKRAAEQAAYNERYNVNKKARRAKAITKAAAKQEELEQLQKQNALMQFIRRGKMKRLAVEIEDLERIYKGRNLPAAPLAVKEGNKWSPFIINQMLGARTLCVRTRKDKMPSRRPPFEHKATRDKHMKAIDKTNKSSAKFVEMETDFTKEVLLGLTDHLQIGVEHKPERLKTWLEGQKGGD